MWLFAAITTSVSIMDGSLCLCAVLPLHPSPRLCHGIIPVGPFPTFNTLITVITQPPLVTTGHSRGQLFSSKTNLSGDHQIQYSTISR